ncbi:unnamed protein product [Rotaria sp. Silwood2]|nr:unnamed protein product [Rotaria sp. Silwood2]
MLNRVVQLSTPDSSNPHSVAVGDFNNDHRMDIIVANTGTDNVGVFLLYDNGTFASQSTYPTGYGSAPRMVVVSDFNNDNQLDIAVANFGTNNIGILLGNSDGSFRNQTSIETTPSRPLCLAVGDFNNDKQFDITVANYGTNSIGVHFGFGNAIFTKQITLSTGYDSLPYAVAVGDFNNDNKLDIAFANFGTHNVGIFLGYGNGTFIIQTTYATGTNSHPYFIAIADLNNDGQLDIAVVNSGTDNLGVLFGYENGNFTQPTFYSTGLNSKPVFIAIADFNDDRIADIVVANNGTSNVGVFFGFTNGTFARQIICSTGPQSSPQSIGVADFNNDHKLDIAIADKQNNYVRIFYEFSNVTFASQITYPSSATYGPVGILLYPTGDGSQPYSIALGDFNNDSTLDIVVVNRGTDNIGIFLGYGDGSFSNQMTYTTGISSGPSAVAVGDFNNDSRLDIAVANYGTSNVGVLLGYDNGTFSNQMIYETGINSGPNALAIGDFNNDSRLDIAVANYATSNVGVFLGYGNGSFASQLTYSTYERSYPISLATGDFNNDSRLDIAVANYFGNKVGVFFGHGNGSFTNMTSIPTGAYSNPKALAVSDFNSDGILDIAVVNAAPMEELILILLGNGHGNFSSNGRYETGVQSAPSSIVIGYFNDDSQLDIAVANRGTDNIGIFLGYGDGTFSNQMIYAAGDGFGPISIVADDFNEDNLTDIAAANYYTFTVCVFLAFINTSFEYKATCSTGSAARPGAIATGDLTNNGQIDVIVGNDGTHSIDVLFRDKNGSFSMKTVFSSDFTFYPVCIVVSDFNNDSRLDIAVANSVGDDVCLFFGEENVTFVNYTTYSTGMGSNPQSIAIGDFNNDYREDIVVAHSGTGSVGVLLNVDSVDFESVRIFPTGSGWKPHALAVGDFDTDGRLDITVANNGDANIGFFFGLGNGDFSNQIIVSVGEGIYPIGVDVGDFNNDKRLDVVVANNISPSPIIVLLGNGNHSFQIQMTHGVLPTGTVAVGDFNGDGRLDLVATNYYDNSVTVLLGYGNGTFGNISIYPNSGNSAAYGLAVGDFNNDDRLDFVVAYFSTNRIAVFLGYGDGNFSNQMTYSTGISSHPNGVAVGDFNNDGQLDVAVANQYAYNVGIFLGYGNGSFSNQTAYPTGLKSSPWSLAVEDFNKDDRLDIAIANYGSGSVGILIGHINGTFFNQITHATGDNSNPDGVAVGDFNNDGRLDIAYSDPLKDNIGVFLGYASGSLLATEAYQIGKSSEPVSIAVGDFNKDTLLDVAIADQGTNELIILYGSGYGTFTSQANYSTGNNSYPNSVAVGDFNQDHQLDIAIINSGTNSIGIFLGNWNGTFSSLTTYLIKDFSSLRSLTIGLFDNDTALDLAVANYGTNNIAILLGYGNGSFASPMFFTTGFGAHPAAMAFGDLNIHNTTDIFVCNSGYSTIDVLSKTC